MLDAKKSTMQNTGGENRILLGLALLAVLFGADAVCAQVPTTSTTDALSQYFEQSGRGYKDCGRVPIDGSGRAMVDDCILDALGSKTPFFARYDKLSDDSDFAYGLLFSRSHRLVVLVYDSWACSDVKCVRVNSCDLPKVEKRDNELHIRCANEYEM